MRQFWKLALAASLLPAFGGAALAQSMTPDPSHIPFTLPKDIPWQGDPAKGELTYPLFGDPNKPGMYGILIKWLPGHYSHPHSHSTTRYITVISGTWWVSSSDVYDPSKTFPFHAGTIAKDLPGTVHWDGAKDEPCVIEIVGMGPVLNKNGPQPEYVGKTD